jgi:AcrR family transcriptional regulator
MGRHQTISDEQIVQRARAVFLERGYDVRTRLLASLIGLSWPAIVLRFGSKWELFRRAVIEPMRRLEQSDAPGHADDLRELLERARAALAERWLLQLHCRLAAAGTGTDAADDRWMQRFAAALGVYAERGAIRSDLSTGELARHVTTMLLGQAAHAFAQGHPVTDDRGFVDCVMRVLRPQTQARGARPHAAAAVACS